MNESNGGKHTKITGGCWDWGVFKMIKDIINFPAWDS